MTVYSMYIYEIIVHIKQNVSLLKTLGDNHNYSTRGRNQLEMPAHRLNFYEKKTNC